MSLGLIVFCDLCPIKGVEVPEEATETRDIPIEDGGTILARLCVHCTQWTDMFMRHYGMYRALVSAVQQYHASHLGQLLEAAAAQMTPNESETAQQLAVAEPPRAIEARTGARDEDSDHVICRDCKPTRRVPYADREKHARSVHGKDVHEVLWLTLDRQPLPFDCDEHSACEDTGYGFLTEAELREHLAQLPATVEQAAEEPKKKPQKEEKGSKKRQKHSKPGEWIPDVDQVVCTLKHRDTHPDPYWVKVSQRGSHADSHDCRPQEVPWENPADVPLPYICTTHELCAKAGGYGHPTKASLQTHLQKAREAGWKLAEKDEETSGQSEVPALA